MTYKFNSIQKKNLFSAVSNDINNKFNEWNAGASFPKRYFEIGLLACENKLTLALCIEYINLFYSNPDEVIQNWVK